MQSEHIVSRAPYAPEAARPRKAQPVRCGWIPTPKRIVYLHNTGIEDMQTIKCHGVGRGEERANKRSVGRKNLS
ncbi:unnamed protein product [Lasius platythorax]|uniref:Uncharacterized protein n=1 Tax=Lasius platythorax TaxID=488582 RepID=A0AAV2P3Q0_9HYME